jgi:hypothetical protein
MIAPMLEGRPTGPVSPSDVRNSSASRYTSGEVRLKPLENKNPLSGLRQDALTEMSRLVFPE